MTVGESGVEALAKRHGIAYRGLGLLQRVLLITNGTLTEILEATFLESIELVKLSQRIIAAEVADEQLMLEAGDEIVERAILLRGATSGRNYVYAASRIATGRLAAEFRTSLMGSGEPLGRLWIRHRLETFKELLEMRIDSGSEVARHFESDGPVLQRTYRVFSSGRPVMMITEHFPASLGGVPAS